MINIATVARAAIPSRGDGHSVRRARGNIILCLGIVAALIAEGGRAMPHSVLSAQTTPEPAHLSVRPGDMASGTRTTQAGLHRLDSLNNGDSLRGAYVYVPPQCVGTRRVPLVVFLHGAGMNGLEMIEYADGIVRTLADSNGFIILAPSSQGSTWDLPLRNASSPNVRRIDDAMRYVLSHYAIDPTKIAVAGASDGATYTLFMGYVNGDVFSRVLALAPGMQQSGGPNDESPDYSSVDSLAFLPRHGAPPIFIGQGVNDETLPITDTRGVVPWLRHAGYPVTFVEDSGTHGMTQERAISAFHWLAESWR